MNDLLHLLNPVLNPGTFVFCSLRIGQPIDFPVLATFLEDEGLTVVVEESVALARDWPILFRAAWISLKVHSDLQAVGLTASVAGALAKAGVACNIMAGAHHDHIFVPIDSCEVAIEALIRLQATASAAGSRP